MVIKPIQAKHLILIERRIILLQHIDINISDNTHSMPFNADVEHWLSRW